jgi:ribosome biogenesis protein UTP30
MLFLLQVQLLKNVAKEVTKPIRVRIPHSMFNDDEEDNTICFFCRSCDKEALSAYLEQNPINGLTKVVSIDECKKHYKQFQEKRQLLREHTHFVCDSRIAGQLYNILGSTFSNRSDYPVQINYEKFTQLPALVQKVIDSTYFHLAGKNLSIRIGMTHMSAEDVTENVLGGLPFAIEKLQNGWKDVHSIHLKTSDSPSLPIYSKVPDEMLAYVQKKVAESSSSSSSVASAASANGSAIPKAKGKASAIPVAAAAPAAPAAAPVAAKKTSGIPVAAKKSAPAATKAVEEEKAAPASSKKRPVSATTSESEAPVAAAGPAAGATKKQKVVPVSAPAAAAAAAAAASIEVPAPVATKPAAKKAVAVKATEAAAPAAIKAAATKAASAAAKSTTTTKTVAEKKEASPALTRSSRRKA